MNYITREGTCTELLGARLPTERQALKRWMYEQEDGDRKNARIIDRVMVALPADLSHDENAALVRAYCEAMTKGRASWAAAIHDTPAEVNEKGQFNPHAHIIFRDRDFETGERVMFTSAAPREAEQLRGQGVEVIDTKALRAGWSEHCNMALELAGLDARVDHRKRPALETEAAAYPTDLPLAVLVPDDLPLAVLVPDELPLAVLVAGGGSSERAPQRDAGDLAAGAAGAVVDMVAGEAENLFTPPSLAEQAAAARAAAMKHEADKEELHHEPERVQQQARAADTERKGKEQQQDGIEDALAAFMKWRTSSDYNGSAEREKDGGLELER